MPGPVHQLTEIGRYLICAGRSNDVLILDAATLEVRRDCVRSDGREGRTADRCKPGKGLTVHWL